MGEAQVGTSTPTRSTTEIWDLTPIQGSVGNLSLYRQHSTVRTGRQELHRGKSCGSPRRTGRLGARRGRWESGYWECWSQGRLLHPSSRTCSWTWTPNEWAVKCTST